VSYKLNLTKALLINSCEILPLLVMHKGICLTGLSLIDHFGSELGRWAVRQSMQQQSWSVVGKISIAVLYSLDTVQVAVTHRLWTDSMSCSC